MEEMKLIVQDKGDPSVGIFECSWEVECPFSQKDAEPETLEFFREEIRKLYQEFAEGRIVCEYDFEIKQGDEFENQIP